MTIKLKCLKKLLSKCIAYRSDRTGAGYECIACGKIIKDHAGKDWNKHKKVVHICILKSYWREMTKSKKREFIKEFDKLLEELKNIIQIWRQM